MRIKPILLGGVSVNEEELTRCAGCQFSLLVSGRRLPDIPIPGFYSHPICQELEKRERIALISSGGSERKYGCLRQPSLISRLKSRYRCCSSFPARIDGGGDRNGTPMRSAPILKSILLGNKLTVLIK
ncbi:hypothetical protein KCP73_17550 [Salmonella enterica subsp. enterica]|nr:hypothetical protein KCP73_17550 [Salmonella enterica subsp. enterica]